MVVKKSTVCLIVLTLSRFFAKMPAMTNDERLTNWVNSHSMSRAVFGFSEKHEYVSSGILAVLLFFGFSATGAYFESKAREGEEMIPICSFDPNKRLADYTVEGKRIVTTLPLCEDYFRR